MERDSELVCVSASDFSGRYSGNQFEFVGDINSECPEGCLGANWRCDGNVENRNVVRAYRLYERSGDSKRKHRLNILKFLIERERRAFFGIPDEKFHDNNAFPSRNRLRGDIVYLRYACHGIFHSLCEKGVNLFGGSAGKFGCYGESGRDNFRIVLLWHECEGKSSPHNEYADGEEGNFLIQKEYPSSFSGESDSRVGGF